MIELQTQMPTLRSANRGDGAGGYLVSSFELRSGLEVKALAATSLPAEVLRELQRLRQCWEHPPAVAAAGWLRP